MNNRARCSDGASSRRRRKRSDAAGDDDGSDRECDANAERRDDDIRFGVVPVLQGLIPAIEHLDDRRTERDGDDRRDEESPSR
jgi:hypothetical protein